jgi:TPR repeat protein
MIPQLYFDYMRTGDARPLKSVFYHNAVDVLSMAALLQHIVGMLADPLGPAVQEPLDLLGMGRLHESLGHTDRAIELFERALAGGLPSDRASKARQRLSLIHKRRENWPAALNLWREAAAEGDLYACVELAKYYEHRVHDFRKAARWTQEALARAVDPDRSHAVRQRWLPDLQHRLARLRRRMRRQAPRHPEPPR